MPRFKTVVNTGAEVGFVTVRNDSGSALSAGQVVAWDMAGTEDGLRVIDPSGTSAGLVVGLAHSATADGDKGLVQVYGVDDDALVLRNGVTATNDTLAVGDLLDITSASSCLDARKAAGAILANTFAATNNAVATVLPPMFVLCTSFASYATSDVTTNAKIFIRCL